MGHLANLAVVCPFASGRSMQLELPCMLQDVSYQLTLYALLRRPPLSSAAQLKGWQAHEQEHRQGLRREAI